MQEVLEAAERQAKEEKRQQQHQRRHRDGEADGAEADSHAGEAATPSRPVDKEAKQALNRAVTADSQ